MGTKSSESKVEIIKVASTGPLAFFALVILFAVIGLLTSLTQIDDTNIRLAIVLGAVLIILAMVIFAGLNLVSRRGSGIEYPGHGRLLGDRAIRGFFEGGSSEKLQGRWEVTWQQRDESGNLHPYTIEDDETGEEKTYPPEIVSVKVHGAMISAEAHDTTTKLVYYMEGRISIRDTVTLIYWSEPGVEEASLVGVLILQVDHGYKTTQMSGQWIGYDRKDQTVSGQVHWKKLTEL